MRRFLLILGLVGVLAVVGGIVFLMWDLDWRWQPHTVTKNQIEIAKALDQSGWVSPHLTGPKVYVIGYRSCEDCLRFEQNVFPHLQDAGVDTRVILIAQPDLNGQARSTPAERNTVAELWTNRSWKLFQQWSLVTPAAWPATGIPSADGDAARTAVLQVGRDLVTSLTSELKDNGIDFAYPTVIWWTKDGKMRACSCTSPHSYGYVEKELGA
jgi:hypothetical protein